jgi:hypothetical protein
MVDINRCIFRPPVHRDFPGRSYGTIHWDADPRAPGPASLQAVVLLTGLGRDEGGFQCLPEVYKNLDAWLQQYAMRDDFDYFNPGLKDLRTTQVEVGRAMSSCGRPGFRMARQSICPPAHGSQRLSPCSHRMRVRAFESR